MGRHSSLTCPRPLLSSMRLCPQSTTGSVSTSACPSPVSRSACSLATRGARTSGTGTTRRSEQLIPLRDDPYSSKLTPHVSISGAVSPRDPTATDLEGSHSGKQPRSLSPTIRYTFPIPSLSLADFAPRLCFVDCSPKGKHWNPGKTCCEMPPPPHNNPPPPTPSGKWGHGGHGHGHGHGGGNKGHNGGGYKQHGSGGNGKNRYGHRSLVPQRRSLLPIDGRIDAGRCPKNLTACPATSTHVVSRDFPFPLCRHRFHADDRLRFFG